MELQTVAITVTVFFGKGQKIRNTSTNLSLQWQGAGGDASPVCRAGSAAILIVEVVYPVNVR